MKKGKIPDFLLAVIIMIAIILIAFIIVISPGIDTAHMFGTNIEFRQFCNLWRSYSFNYNVADPWIEFEDSRYNINQECAKALFINEGDISEQTIEDCEARCRQI